MARTLLRLSGVKSKTGLTTSQIYDGQKDGTFPQSVALSERTVAWVESEIDEWIAKRIAQRDSLSLGQARLQRARKAGPGRPRKSAQRREIGA